MTEAAPDDPFSPGTVPPRRSGRSDVLALLALAAAWALAVALIDPRGDFPVTDDWAWAYSVRALLDHHDLRLSDWGATNLLTQIGWGAAFGQIFGANYTTLRCATLIAGALGGMALYRTARLVGIAPAPALLVAATLLFDPLYLSLSFTFMTDVFYTALQTIALWLLVSAATRRSRGRRAAGWAVAVAALLVRQVAIAIPLGLAVEGVWRRPFSGRRIVGLALPVVAFLLIQLGYTRWLAATGRLPRYFGRQVDDLAGVLRGDPTFLVHQVASGIVLVLTYLGLLLLPVAIAATPGALARVPRRWRSRLLLGGAACAGLLLVLNVAVARTLFPSWGNTLTAGGIGMEVQGVNAPLVVRAAMMLVACGGAGLLLIALIGLATDYRRRSAGVRPPLAMLLVAVFLVGPTLIIVTRLDRYLLPLLPCLLVALATTAPPSTFRRPALAAGYVALAAMAIASTAGVHDFMAAKRAQSSEYRRLVAQVPATYVDGGWVLNAPTQFARYGTADTLDHWYARADWIVAVADAPPAGYVVVRRRAVRRWLPWNGDRKPVIVAAATVGPPRSAGPSQLTNRRFGRAAATNRTPTPSPPPATSAATQAPVSR